MLIADDEPNILIPLEFLFKREGFEVQLATDGERARDIAIAERPDVVLLDVVMPKMNGYEVCRALRADARLCDIKIIMLTARGREGEQARGKAAGADRVVTKPFSTQDLIAEVRSVLAADA